MKTLNVYIYQVKTAKESFLVVAHSISSAHEEIVKQLTEGYPHAPTPKVVSIREIGPVDMVAPLVGP
jgi:hypothetical protein